LLDRFPAEKRLEARIDVAKMYNIKTTKEIEQDLLAIQKQNQLLLAEIKEKNWK
jgi:hypothetical protein